MDYHDHQEDRKPAKVIVLAKIVRCSAGHYVLTYDCPWCAQLRKRRRKRPDIHMHAMFGPGGILGGPRASHCWAPGAPRSYWLKVVNPELLRRAPQWIARGA
jgi:hypothetical protein